VVTMGALIIALSGEGVWIRVGSAMNRAEDTGASDAVEVGLRVLGPDVTALMGSLEAWLTGREELRGGVRAVAPAPYPGAMGSAADVLMVVLGQGGVATALASVLISWIRGQSGKVSVTAKRRDSAEIIVTADRVRGLTQDGIQLLVARLATALDGGEVGELAEDEVEKPEDRDTGR
jgi:hypothetical protein